MKASLCFISLLFLNIPSFTQVNIVPSGDVGIGITTTPQFRLHVEKSGNLVTGLYANGNYYSRLWLLNNVMGIGMEVDATGRFNMMYNYQSPSLILSAKNKYVSIGTQTVDMNTLLKIQSGNNEKCLFLQHSATADYNRSSQVWCNRGLTKNWVVFYPSLEDISFYVNGNGQVYSYGYNTLSDSTYKENITPLTNSLQKVLLLNGVSYNFKMPVLASTDTFAVLNTGSYPTRIGLIAQDVNQVIPEVVSLDENNRYTINYPDLVALLIEGMKEQQAQIEELKARIDELEIIQKKCCEENSGSIQINNPE